MCRGYSRCSETTPKSPSYSWDSELRFLWAGNCPAWPHRSTRAWSNPCHHQNLWGVSAGDSQILLLGKATELRSLSVWELQSFSASWLFINEDCWGESYFKPISSKRGTNKLNLCIIVWNRLSCISALPPSPSKSWFGRWVGSGSGSRVACKLTLPPPGSMSATGVEWVGRNAPVPLSSALLGCVSQMFSRPRGSASPLNSWSIQIWGSCLRLAAAEILGLRLNRFCSCMYERKPKPTPPFLNKGKWDLFIPEPLVMT